MKDWNEAHVAGISALDAADAAWLRADPLPDPPPEPAPPIRASFQDIASFIAGYEPVEYLIDGIVRSGSLYTLTAKTGHGKTGFLVTAAFALATGNRDLLGRDVQPTRVAYIAAENPDDIRMRLAITAYRFAVDVQSIADHIMILDRRPRPEELIDQLARHSAQGSFGLVIGDTLAALFDGKDFNEAVQTGEFIRRLRPITRLPGFPSAIVAAHPIKSATAETLIPYGSGAILNEVDGNLTMWKSGGIASLHWQGKFRGIEFSPLAFKFEEAASPDLLDARGRQVTLPVCVPTTEEAVEERDAAEGSRNVIVLKAIAADPKASQRSWTAASGLAVGTFNRGIADLAKRGFIERGADDRWRLSRKGERDISA